VPAAPGESAYVESVGVDSPCSAVQGSTQLTQRNALGCEWCVRVHGLCRVNTLVDDVPIGSTGSGMLNTGASSSDAYANYGPPPSSMQLNSTLSSTDSSVLVVHAHAHHAHQRDVESIAWSQLEIGSVLGAGAYGEVRGDVLLARSSTCDVLCRCQRRNCTTSASP
jgi:hypothetical protein